MSRINSLSGYETIPPLVKNFPVKIRKYRGARLEPHWHEHLEMIYILEGSCSYIVGGKQYFLASGDLAVANGKEIHSFTADAPLEYYCLLLYPDFFRDVDFSGVMIENRVAGDAQVKEYMEELAQLSEASEPGSDMLQKSVAYSLTAYLRRHYQRERMTRRERELRGAAITRLDRVMQLIAEGYGRELSTRDLAAASYLSVAHFCRFFKAEMGKSPLEYLTEYRLERARALLEETELSLSEIADSVGFSDVNYFCRVFRRTLGKSPAHYRLEFRRAAKDEA